jgi:hypothetical protein
MLPASLRPQRASISEHSLLATRLYTRLRSFGASPIGRQEPTHCRESCGRPLKGLLTGRCGHPNRQLKDSSSAGAAVGKDWVLRPQWKGLLTVTASSRRTAASFIGELTLPTHKGQSTF